MRESQQMPLCHKRTNTEQHTVIAVALSLCPSSVCTFALTTAGLAACAKRAMASQESV
eukprot:CAMPEP_0172746302 /NCGR_PEP_ID=MMETSP1074-20121228/140216_1 /TAXON_ID=2916 /ORGANISM="Ceratium fusus, Strain PA161109" /LENGTH=57 /DNA_ID=CAMNT_0013577637 /DNA_START=37 /DNA_END=206 /DNA_ORIENTATION=-